MVHLKMLLHIIYIRTIFEFLKNFVLKVKDAKAGKRNISALWALNGLRHSHG